MIPNWKIYPRSQGHSTVYLRNVVNDPAITVGDYTIYDDQDPYVKGHPEYRDEAGFRRNK